MFNSIAPRYDLLNHVLSANIDRLWWRRTARRFRATLAKPEAAILDVCCGTGDMTIALLKLRPHPSRPILAVDFAHEMLARGAKKFGPSPNPSPNPSPDPSPDLIPASSPQHPSPRPYAIPIEADALHLPLAPASLDLITTAFGFRNLANYPAGLDEFHRVLKPGGQLGILEFSEPGGAVGRLYQFYFRRVLPAIGRLLCGKDGPYNYLPTSVSRFPSPPEILRMMEAAGFREVRWTPYTFGIAGLFTGIRQ
jgi:demethylmenaquinone methyltransferase/2-methoxy-6-polyprenyl-1,4-benzoquinol methylase